MGSNPGPYDGKHKQSQMTIASAPPPYNCFLNRQSPASFILFSLLDKQK